MDPSSLNHGPPRYRLMVTFIQLETPCDSHLVRRTRSGIHAFSKLFGKRPGAQVRGREDEKREQLLSFDR